MCSSIICDYKDDTTRHHITAGLSLFIYWKTCLLLHTTLITLHHLDYKLILLICIFSEIRYSIQLLPYIKVQLVQLFTTGD